MLTAEGMFPVNTEVLYEQLKSEEKAVGMLEEILEDAVPVSQNMQLLQILFYRRQKPILKVSLQQRRLQTEFKIVSVCI